MRVTSARQATSAVAGSIAVVALALAGCSGPTGNAQQPGRPGEAREPGKSAAPSSEPPKALPKGVRPAPIPSKVANDPADRKNVVMTSCEAAKGGWQAGGTATNPTKKDVEYKITVFFTTTSATTINTASTDVPVKAGQTVKWSAKQDFAAPKEMLCVLRGVNA
jgi:hypothetical protein